MRWRAGKGRPVLNRSVLREYKVRLGMDFMLVIYLALAALAGLAAGAQIHKAVVAKRLGDAEGLAQRIVLEARKEAQAQKK